MPTSIKYQLIALEKLTQQSRCKRADSYLLADENAPHHWIQVIVWVIYLYLYIYYVDNEFIFKLVFCFFKLIKIERTQQFYRVALVQKK